MKLMELASITTEGPAAIIIAPFDPSIILDVERAILKSTLGLSPQTQGNRIIVKIPSLSQEARVKIKSTNTILYCRNWEQTVEFYRTGLRLPVLSSMEWFVEFKLTETSRVSVADEARTSIRSSGGKGLTLSLQVDDIEQTREELMEAGTTPTPVKEVWGSKVIYIHDPEGNRLEFWSGRAKA